MKYHAVRYLAVAGVAMMAAQSAHAYIGPGAGLTAIGTVLALIGGVLLGIVGFIWYPIKRLIRKIRGPKASQAKRAAAAPASDNADASAQPSEIATKDTP